MAIPGSRQNRSTGYDNRSGRGGYPRPTNPPAPDNFRPVKEAEEVVPTVPRPTVPISPPASSGPFSSEEVREFVKLVHDHSITELLLERDNGAHRLVIKREHPAPAPVMMAPQVAHAAPAPAHESPRPLSMSSAPTPGSVIPDPGAPPQDSFHKVVAPMVGTFYRSPDPKDTPFVKEGDMVEKDQVIGIIEAMKIMNEIKSEHRGRCARVSVENGQPVEYGQTIMLLEPA